MKNNETKLDTQYDNCHEEFLLNHEELNRFNREIFYGYLPEKMNGLILADLGCGNGIDLVEYEKRGAVVFGIDASKEMIAAAEQVIKKEKLTVGSFTSLPYQDNLFDIVVSKYAIQTMPDLKPIFDEAARVLKKDGTFLFMVTHPLRQFMERNTSKKPRNYFDQEIVESHLFHNTVTVYEPTHTFAEYFSNDFMQNFEIITFDERYDPWSAEHVEQSQYPGFMIIKARKK